MSQEVKVSIIMPVYNHEKYIKKAISSIQKQKTNFKYEILVADDCSIDQTRNILNKYFSNMEQIRFIFQTKNLGGTKNMFYCLKNIVGKYFIMLEGDDYWENENMLQSQVDFLEENQDYIGVGGKLNVINEHGRYLYPMMPDTYYNREFTLNHFLNGETLHFRAILWKKKIIDEIGEELRLLYKADSMLGDFTLNILFLEKGKIYLRNIIIANYRYVMKKGSTNYNSLRSNFEKYADHMRILRILEERHRPKHDYSVIYDSRTIKYVKEILVKKHYAEIFKVIQVIGWYRFFHALERYYQYVDYIIT